MCLWSGVIIFSPGLWLPGSNRLRPPKQRSSSMSFNCYFVPDLKKKRLISAGAWVLFWKSSPLYFGTTFFANCQTVVSLRLTAQTCSDMEGNYVEASGLSFITQTVCVVLFYCYWSDWLIRVWFLSLQVYGHERPDDGATERFDQTGRRQWEEGGFILVPHWFTGEFICRLKLQYWPIDYWLIGRWWGWFSNCWKTRMEKFRTWLSNGKNTTRSDCNQ